MHSHVSRITLFSTALAIQIFGQEDRATVVTLGVECFILVLFGIMSSFVMQLFYKNDNVDDVDPPEDHNPPPTGRQHDVEQGSVKCYTFHGR